MVLAAAVLGFGACTDPEPAIVRGDRLWADSSYELALAEYRLALRQSGDDEDVLLRVAHAYARNDQLTEAQEAYTRLIARAPEYTDQAVYDFLALAERARARGDRFGVAGGVEAALALRPELTVGELAPMLARYHQEMGQGQRALEFYERALSTTSPDSTAGLLYEIGMIHVGRDDCRSAIGYFTAYRQRAPGTQRAREARWQVGNCAFRLGEAAYREGRLMDALEHLTRVTELADPANVLDRAWFDRGEILYALGRFDEALESYRMVLEVNRARGGALFERAQQRIDELRFGSWRS